MGITNVFWKWNFDERPIGCNECYTKVWPDACVLTELPIWNFDGSSTGQASGENSDVYIKPVAIYPDPFRRGKHKLVLCETLDHEMKPHGKVISPFS